LVSLLVPLIEDAIISRREGEEKLGSWLQPARQTGKEQKKKENRKTLAA